jgi:hypothetical protein
MGWRTGKSKKVKGKRQKAVGSGQWAVGSGQWAVGSGQWAVGRGQWAVGSGQWAVGSGQWAVGSGQWAVGSGQWAVEKAQSSGKRNADPSRVGELFCWGDDPGVALRLRQHPTRAARAGTPLPGYFLARLRRFDSTRNRAWCFLRKPRPELARRVKSEE